MESAIVIVIADSVSMVSTVDGYCHISTSFHTGRTVKTPSSWRRMWKKTQLGGQSAKRIRLVRCRNSSNNHVLSDETTINFYVLCACGRLNWRQCAKPLDYHSPAGT
ncbi:hypothetical protein Dimus_039208 [Dionaea muscipula]